MEYEEMRAWCLDCERWVVARREDKSIMYRLTNDPILWRCVNCQTPNLRGEDEQLAYWQRTADGGAGMAVDRPANLTVAPQSATGRWVRRGLGLLAILFLVVLLAALL